jgi:hypothetical protein
VIAKVIVSLEPYSYEYCTQSRQDYAFWVLIRWSCFFTTCCSSAYCALLYPVFQPPTAHSTNRKRGHYKYTAAKTTNTHVYATTATEGFSLSTYPILSSRQNVTIEAADTRHKLKQIAHTTKLPAWCFLEK